MRGSSVRATERQKNAKIVTTGPRALKYGM